ncbi:prolyl endopeptidase FAP-like isoform X4 [Apostichopus japonicus]|uniref:prolyl endopeptidase FAP-like isoform X4 n=1 Tax=Stichopus japonicus TaxID=307972 RepID=UPI003AB5BA8D
MPKNVFCHFELICWESTLRKGSNVFKMVIKTSNRSRVVLIDLEELVGRTQETRNWGGMIISIIVIILICATIVTVAVIVSERRHLVPKFEFEDVFESSMKENLFHYHWLDESVYVSRNEENNLVKRDVLKNNSEIVLLDNRTWNVEGASDFSVSPDVKYILLICHKVHEYGQSYSAIYKIYDVDEQKLLPTLKPENVTDEETRLRYASWSPTKSQASLIFVYEGNIYYMEDIKGSSRQITFDGKENLIYNGVPDVAFSDKTLGSDHAIYWFGEGGRFVYAKFDDTDVETSWVSYYDHLANPKLEYFPYPKPGGKFPKVTLHVVDVENGDRTVDLTAPEPLADVDHFYKYVVWMDRDNLSVTWLNRTQDYAVVSICNVNSGTCRKSISEESKDGWVVVRNPPVFSEDGRSFAFILELPDQDAKDKHYHIRVFTTEDGEEVGKLTEGKYEVSKIVAYHADNNVVFYLANSEGKPWERHLYRVALGGTPICLSCHVNSSCSYYDAEVVAGTSKYVLYCQGPGVPNSTFHDFDQSNYSVLEGNSDFRRSVYSKVHLIQESHVFRVHEKRIPVKILYHNKKDPLRKHPLLINIIDEPGSNSVTSEFYQGWFTYLASRYHVITANINFRGTSGFGRRHLQGINRKLGIEETEDIIAVTEFIRNSSLGVVSFNDTQFDQNKVALIGQSYGGFLASMAYARSTFFNCSIAVSPITDWRHYGAVLTEKFMDMPTSEDNLQGYKNANLSSLAHLFRNDTFLIAHGMADKSVHFQHSANLVKTLAEKNVQFRTLFYPDEGHELWDSKVKKSLYQSLTNFLVDCLQLDQEECS